MIRLIVGLGNPGTKYVGTRHNLGRRVVEALATSLDISWQRWRGNQVAENRKQKTENSFLILLNGYMNLSGGGVGEFVRFHKLNPNQIVIVHDELDLAFGTIQLKLGGRAAGHKGVQSVIDHLETDQFWRLRLGIGRPDTEIRKDDEVTAFVLGQFLANEEAVVEKSVDGAVRLLVESLQNEPKATILQTE